MSLILSFIIIFLAAIFLLNLWGVRDWCQKNIFFFAKVISKLVTTADYEGNIEFFRSSSSTLPSILFLRALSRHGYRVMTFSLFVIPACCFAFPEYCNFGCAMSWKFWLKAKIVEYWNLHSNILANFSITQNWGNTEMVSSVARTPSFVFWDPLLSNLLFKGLVFFHDRPSFKSPLSF